MPRTSFARRSPRCANGPWHTATTFDAVDFAGTYKGGIIAPGINLSLDALVSATAKLPRIAIEVPRTHNVVGRNTEDQMVIGVFWGYVAMIEGLVARMRAEISRLVGRALRATIDLAHDLGMRLVAAGWVAAEASQPSSSSARTRA